MLLTPSMCSQALGPTSNGTRANAFSLAARVKISAFKKRRVNNVPLESILDLRASRHLEAILCSVKQEDAAALFRCEAPEMFLSAELILRS